MGGILMVTDYDSYEMTNGIMYPSHMKQTTGDQSFDIEIENVEFNKDIEEEVFE